MRIRAMAIMKKILIWTLFIMPFLLLSYFIMISVGLINISHKRQPFEAISDMDHQAKIKPQSIESNKSIFVNNNSNSENNISLENTLPREGWYRYGQLDFAKAETELKNPVELTGQTLNRGKNRFECFCMPCHGKTGDGSGFVVTKVELVKEDDEGFPQPPSYHRPETIALKDERIFHIISTGQNLMFPFANRISEADRWCLVLYIRYLQSKDINHAYKPL